MKGRLAPALLTSFCDPLCEKFKEQILLWGKDKQGMSHPVCNVCRILL